MASVIIRKSTDTSTGQIIHNDEQSTHEAAEQFAGRKLDRRKNYAIIGTQVCEFSEWSQACSGCYEGFDTQHSKGMGCHECGYTGRVRRGMWVPIQNTTR